MFAAPCFPALHWAAFELTDLGILADMSTAALGWVRATDRFSQCPGPGMAHRSAIAYSWNIPPCVEFPSLFHYIGQTYSSFRIHVPLPMKIHWRYFQETFCFHIALLRNAFPFAACHSEYPPLLKTSRFRGMALF